MLARILVTARFLSVSVSACVRHRSVFYQNEGRIELVFGMEASSHLSYTVV